MKGGTNDPTERLDAHSSIESHKNDPLSDPGFSAPNIVPSDEVADGHDDDAEGDGDKDCRRGRRIRETRLPEIEVITEDTPLLPPGEYDAVGGTWSVVTIFKTTKLIGEWIVLIPDPTCPSFIRRVPVRRFYNVKRGPGGRFKAGGNSQYRRDWIFVTNRRPARRDRLSPNVFKGVLATVELRTVTHDSKQRPLTSAQQYSVVERIVEVKAGGGRHAR